MTDDWQNKHPYADLPGSDASMFIQWKGTNVCLDFHCPCGESGHFDTDFLYFVHCPSCDAVYEMGCQVVAKKLPDGTDPEAHNAKTLEDDGL